MMPPAWLLDTFAALMLVVAAVSAIRLIAGRLPAGRLSVAELIGPYARLRGSDGADNDIAYLLMGIAMAGMLAASVTTLPSRAWETIFSVLTAWFAWRVARDTRLNGIRSVAGGHSAVHLFQCAAMVYLFAAVATSASMEMTGMGSGAAQSLQFPVLADAFAAVFVCYTVWDLGQLAGRRHSREAAASAGAVPVGDTAHTAGMAALTATAPSNTMKFRAEASRSVASDAALPPRALLLSPAATVASRIAMSVTMAFMLLTMT